MKYQYRKNKGFTLVEMMVAIAVFSIVMVTAMGALLNVIDANNKARAIKTAINNISFALEGITKDMRMGTEYSCSATAAGTLGVDCLTGGNDISFKSSKTINGVENPYVYYKFSDDKLERCVGNTTAGTACPNGYMPITSADLSPLTGKFYILGVAQSKNSNPAQRTQPRMIITISGEAGSKEKIRTSFDLQTSLSQVSRIKI
jgi:prepilin-type N-terminal cleavage/methylation domain-containing protein